MLWKSLLNKPILAIGILLFTVFMLDLSRRGVLFKNPKYIATSCKSAIVMLKKRSPDTWAIDCEKDVLVVQIESNLKTPDPKNLQPALYRELANNIIFISKNSLNESLERTPMVRIKMRHPKYDLNALAEGKYIAKLATMNRPEFIAEQLKNFVSTQIVPKN